MDSFERPPDAPPPVPDDPYSSGDGPRNDEKEPEDLPLGWRIFFVVSGWILLLIGIAGLALPGIQGILTILLGLALIGLASETVHSLLERMLSRWPGLWDRMEGMREKIIDKLQD